MVARIAKAHRGQLVLSADPGQGFCAEMILPAIGPKQGDAADGAKDHDVA